MFWRLDPVGWLIACALLNAIAKPVFAWSFHDAETPNAVSFLCALAGFVTAQRHAPGRVLSRGQRLMLGMALLLMIMPFAFAAWASLASIALVLLWRTGLGVEEKAGLLVLFAASIRTPIAEGAMILLAEPLLMFDGAFANVVGRLIGGGGQLNGNMILGAEGHAVLVMSGCASFANVSNALLIWFTITMLAVRPTRGHLLVMAGALTTAIVSINAIRLGGMTLSREAYQWIHDGNGSLLAEFAMITVVLGALILSLRRGRHG